MIKNRIYILSLIALLAGCVSDVPLQIEDQRVFAVCELKAYEQVSVYANNTGNTTGELPYQLQNPEDLKMSIIEGTKDNPNDLIYDYDARLYGIDKVKFVPKPGLSYRWTGLTNLNEPDPQLVMPQPVAIDSAKATLVSESADNKIIELVIKVPKFLRDETFFHIDPKVVGSTAISAKFIDNVGACKTLLHRSGFLVDYSRVKNGEIMVTLEVTTQKPFQEILIELNNTTSSYYYYNKYKSDNVASTNTAYVIPTISGDALNIFNSKTVGCFSAATSTIFVAKVQ